MNNRSTIQNQPCRNEFTYFILDMHKRKTYQTELFSTCCNEKNKNLSDLYSLRILIDDPGIRARWYVTIRSEPRIRSGLLARRGEGGSVPTNRRKLVAGIYDVSARYGCYAFHPWFVFGVMLKSFRIRSLDAVASERAVYISWFAGLSNFFQVSERSRIP